MTRRLTFFQLLLRGTAADDVIATLERLGAIRSERGARWLFPSPSKSTVTFRLHVGRQEDSTRLGLDRTVEMCMYDLEVSDYWPNTIAHGLGISSTAVHRLIVDADALIEVCTQDKRAACDTLPRIVRALLETHEGIAYDDWGVWTSEELRAGRAQGLEPRPVPSIAEEYERSDAVFVGEVVAEQHVPDWTECPLSVMYTLNVDEVLRGKLPRTIRVFSEHGRCHYFPMVVGKTYILFVSHAGGRTTVDDCGNSGSLLAAPETLTAVRQLMQKQDERGGHSREQ